MEHQVVGGAVLGWKCDLPVLARPVERCVRILLAKHAAAALEGVLIHVTRPPNEELFDIRLRGASFSADSIAIDRCVAPAENFEAFCGRNALENAFALETAVFVDGKKDHGDAVRTGARQLDAKFAALPREEDMGDLDQNACAVAGLGIAACSTTMGEVNEHLEALADDVVALFALDAGHEAHPTGVVLIPWMIETLRLWKRVTLIRYLHGYLLRNKIGVQFQSGLPTTMWHFCFGTRRLFLK